MFISAQSITDDLREKKSSHLYHVDLCVYQIAFTENLPYCALDCGDCIMSASFIKKEFGIFLAVITRLL